MYSSVIVVAAGKGERLKSRTPKPLVKINSIPLIVYSLRVFNKLASVRQIIVVASSESNGEIASLARKYKINKLTDIVPGGSRRQDSVNNGLKFLDAKAGVVLIHDAARPFIDKNLVSRLIRKADTIGAAIAAVPVKATIKQSAMLNHKHSGSVVKSTLDRSRLWEIQTPQVFRKDIIIEAYRRFNKENFTDDSALVEKLGKRVALEMGFYSNIKITTPEDLIIAGALLKEKL